jgi:hypothetical protein
LIVPSSFASVVAAVVLLDGVVVLLAEGEASFGVFVGHEHAVGDVVGAIGATFSFSAFAH